MTNIFVDTDIFVRDLRYKRDRNMEDNTHFLNSIKESKNGVTSIFNVLEVCGILSYNFSYDQLVTLFDGFNDQYKVQILFPGTDLQFVYYDIPAILEQIHKKQNLGDAQVSYAIRHFASRLSCFVTWNLKDFEGKISVPVFTPTEFLKKRGKKF